MSKSIAVILGLKDNMSPKLIKVKENVGKLNTEQVRALNAANAMADGFANGCTRMLKVATATAAAVTTALAGIGLKEAFSLESYKTQLVTATKNTERAAEVMRYAIDLANRTPFEGGDLVAASAALEMAGLKTEDYLTLLGDTAAGANRKISEVQNGFIKSLTTGDMTEFLQSINISKKSLEDFAKSKGISDTKEALAFFLQEKFGGGMEKLAKTANGTFSTISGAAKNILANIVGIDNAGNVVAGSLLDNVKTKAEDIANMFMQWQNDGTIDNIRAKVSGVATAIFSLAEGVLKVIGFLSNPVVLGVTTGLVTTIGLLKGIYSVTTMIAGFSKAMATINAMLKLANLELAKTKMLSWSIAASGVVGLVAALGGGLLMSSMMSKSNVHESSNSLGYDPYNGVPDTDEIPENALGTSYFVGGKTKINEYGPETAVLPEGTKILTARETHNIEGSKSVINNVNNITEGAKNIVLNIHIDGAQRSDEELAEIVAGRILEEMEDI